MVKQKIISKTGERVLPEDFESAEEYLIYLRHLFAYRFAQEKLKQDCWVLEVGSGEGYGTDYLSKSEKVREIIGIDVDLDSVKHALEKYGSNKLRFEHYQGDKIPFQDNSFDVIVSFQVIEHIQDDNNYLLEIHRVLKKNGIYILITPNRVYRLKPGQKPWNRFHVREYDDQSLKSVLADRFENVEILGIRGNREAQRIELARIKKDLRMISFDPLGLRNLIPEPCKPFVKLTEFLLVYRRIGYGYELFRRKNG